MSFPSKNINIRAPSFRAPKNKDQRKEGSKNGAEDAGLIFDRYERVLDDDRIPESPEDFVMQEYPIDEEHFNRTPEPGFSYYHSKVLSPLSIGDGPELGLQHANPQNEVEFNQILTHSVNGDSTTPIRPSFTISNESFHDSEKIRQDLQPKLPRKSRLVGSQWSNWINFQKKSGPSLLRRNFDEIKAPFIENNLTCVDISSLYLNAAERLFLESCEKCSNPRCTPELMFKKILGYALKQLLKRFKEDEYCNKKITAEDIKAAFFNKYFPPDFKMEFPQLIQKNKKGKDKIRKFSTYDQELIAKLAINKQLTEDLLKIFRGMRENVKELAEKEVSKFVAEAENWLGETLYLELNEGNIEIMKKRFSLYFKRRVVTKEGIIKRTKLSLPWSVEKLRKALNFVRKAFEKEP